MKIEHHINQIPDPQTRQAVQALFKEVVAEFADHKAKFDAHTHTANDTPVVAGQQFAANRLTSVG